MVTFCKFPQKYFIRFVFFLSSTGDNLSPLHPTHHQPHPAQINLSPTISTPTFSAQPERKCQKKLQTYQTFALPNPHSPRARAQYLRVRAGTRGNIRAARSGCARPRRRVYNIAAGLASCCWAGVLLLGWRPAAGLASCCLAGGLLPGWRAAARLAGCCRAGVLLPGWRAAAGLAGCCRAGGLLPGWRSGPILCSLCKLHSCTP